MGFTVIKVCMLYWAEDIVAGFQCGFREDTKNIKFTELRIGLVGITPLLKRRYR